MAVKILEYALDNIEVICNEAGFASETISARFKAAIYEAKDKGKKKDDIPDRFKEEKSYKGESGKDTAKRVLKNLENTI